MNIINCTPHSITLNGIELDGAGDDSARMKEEDKTVDIIDGIPVKIKCFNENINLPEPQDNTIFIVSRIVAENNAHRRDLFTTCDPVRDKSGKIIGCKSLSTFASYYEGD